MSYETIISSTFLCFKILFSSLILDNVSYTTCHLQICYLHSCLCILIPGHSVLNSAVNGIQEFAQPWQVLYQKSYIPRSKSFITTIWEGGSGINGLVRLRKHRQNHKALDLGSMNSKQLLEERRLAMVELLCRID